MTSIIKKTAVITTLIFLAACSFTQTDPYAEFTAQELESDQTITTTVASFADKYPPAVVSRCEAMTHESYEKGTRCYRVINRNWERGYKQAYANADNRTRAVLKRYYSSFSSYYLAPATPARQRAAEQSYRQLQRRIDS